MTTPDSQPWPRDLDHVVVAGPDLALAVEHVADLTGVRAAPGGAHPVGTANHLIGFTVRGERAPHYLEVIGPDPAQGVPAAQIPTFGIDHRTSPGLATFATHPIEFEATHASARVAGIDLGEIRPLSRRTPAGDLLEWRITSGMGGSREGVVPFLIDWGDVTQPGLTDLPTLDLLALRVAHPQPERIREIYAVLGVEVHVTAAVDDDAPRLTLVVEGPRGVVELT
ncbi:VOC family protein [Serinibacter salmoneus]|uniref:Glyoxalase-like protein n=1 Tax=Serinibacter salmoneus TaxID=556530 RepID=A0A2A9D0X7_9MICO|nr:VOC family protein [Serinibacter salmoneus]PFG20041.1 glyoxalase-like protein [Serinibacter salmoneus]